MNFMGGKHVGVAVALLLVMVICGCITTQQKKENLSMIKLELTAAKYQLVPGANGQVKVQMEGFGSLADPGNPLLPRQVLNVALPPDAAWNTVSLSFKTEYQEVPGAQDIQAAPPQFTFDEQNKEIELWGEGKNIVSGRNQEVYGQNAYYPQSPVRTLGRAQLRKWKFMRLDFTPAQYNPGTKSLKIAKKVEVVISYQPGSAPVNQKLLDDTLADREAEQFLYNYKQAKDWYRSSLEDGGGNEDKHLVIITTNAILEGSNRAPEGLNLKAFVERKKALGYDVHLITESQYGGISAQAPNAREDKIRAWLQQNYIAYAIKFVLLVGNPDPDNILDPTDSIGDLPMKMCYPGWLRQVPYNPALTPEDGYPTDYYFADLTGNWDLDGDGVFGESAGFSHAEVPDAAITAMPFYVHWLGKIKIQNQRSYTIALRNEGRARVFIDGQLILDRWEPHFLEFSYSAATPLSPGLHDIRIDYSKTTPNGRITVYWNKESENKYTQLRDSDLQCDHPVTGLPADGLVAGYYNNEEYFERIWAADVVRKEMRIDWLWGKGDQNSDPAGPAGVDFFPEVYVGRIPVYQQDYAQLNKILAKTIAQDQLPGGEDWQKRVLISIAESDRFTDEYQHGEFMKNDILIPRHFGYFRIYNDDYGLQPPPESIPCTIDHVVQAWQNGYGHVTWWGHTGANMNRTRCHQLDDTRPSFVFQASCMEGYPESDSNLAYSLLKQGAVNTIADARLSVYLKGPDLTPNTILGMNHFLAYYYAWYFTKENIPSGAALYLATAPSVHWQNNMGFNLYGDPTLTLHTQPETRPDLSVDSCQAAPVTTGGVRHMLVTAVIKNAGPTESSASRARFRLLKYRTSPGPDDVAGEQIQDVPRIPGLQNVLVKSAFPMEPNVRYSVEVEVDFGNAVAESNEENNTFRMDVH
jgi:hypothetical protein